MNPQSAPFTTDQEDRIMRLIGTIWQRRDANAFSVYDKCSAISDTCFEYKDYEIADEIEFLTLVSIRLIGIQARRVR